MIANIRTVVLALGAAAATASAASISERANNRPHNAAEYFPDNTEPKLAEYIYFGGLGKYAGIDPDYFVSSAGSLCYTETSGIDFALFVTLLSMYASAVRGTTMPSRTRLAPATSRPTARSSTTRTALLREFLAIVVLPSA